MFDLFKAYSIPKKMILLSLFLKKKKKLLCFSEVQQTIQRKRE